jgi:hypothetical protein
MIVPMVVCGRSLDDEVRHGIRSPHANRSHRHHSRLLCSTGITRTSGRVPRPPRSRLARDARRSTGSRMAKLFFVPARRRTARWLSGVRRLRGVPSPHAAAPHQHALAERDDAVLRTKWRSTRCCDDAPGPHFPSALSRGTPGRRRDYPSERNSRRSAGLSLTGRAPRTAGRNDLRWYAALEPRSLVQTLTGSARF